MRTTIKTNGLRSEKILQLFPMALVVHSKNEQAVIEHDDPIIFPSDEAVDAALLEQKWDVIRDHRAPLLVEADWLVQRAEDQGVGFAEARAYRQALRDVTKQPDPENVIWPVKP